MPFVVSTLRPLPPLIRLPFDRPDSTMLVFAVIRVSKLLWLGCWIVEELVRTFELFQSVFASEREPFGHLVAGLDLVLVVVGSQLVLVKSVLVLSFDRGLVLVVVGVMVVRVDLRVALRQRDSKSE